MATVGRPAAKLLFIEAVDFVPRKRVCNESRPDFEQIRQA